MVYLGQSCSLVFSPPHLVLQRNVPLSSPVAPSDAYTAAPYCDALMLCRGASKPSCCRVEWAAMGSILACKSLLPCDTLSSAHQLVQHCASAAAQPPRPPQVAATSASQVTGHFSSTAHLLRKLVWQSLTVGKRLCCYKSIGKLVGKQPQLCRGCRCLCITGSHIATCHRNACPLGGRGGHHLNSLLHHHHHPCVAHALWVQHKQVCWPLLLVETLRAAQQLSLVHKVHAAKHAALGLSSKGRQSERSHSMHGPAFQHDPHALSPSALSAFTALSSNSRR